VAGQSIWHFHWAREEEEWGPHALQTCRCGARRTIRGNRGTPIPGGWPRPSYGKIYSAWRMPGPLRRTPASPPPPPPPVSVQTFRDR